jgi:two-component system, NarL family, sensor kinase
MSNEATTLLIIVVSCFAVIAAVMLAAILALAHKRRMAAMESQKQIDIIRAIVETEEAQKAKIASDLHDQIIPILTLSALNLNTKITEIENGTKDFSGAKDEIEKLASIAESIREIAHGIIPKMFTSFGVVKSIETVVKQMNNINETTAVFENQTQFRNELPYSMIYQLSIYNATLEILNNLRKHSLYKSLIVTLENGPDFFTLVFAHDGEGITNDEIKRIVMAGKGIGLKSLQSRIIALNAEIDYKREIGVSTVNLKFPIKDESKN